MKKIYTTYTRYNLWANQQIVDTLSRLSETASEKDLGNSFPSVKKTTLHIWDAEQIWLNRLQGMPILSFPSKNFEGTFAEACTGLLDTSRQFLEFAEKQTEGFFEEELEFNTISFGASRSRAHEMIHHCMNHSTYHRGQLVTMGRQLGLENMPSTDMIFYLRNDS